MESNFRGVFTITPKYPQHPRLHEALEGPVATAGAPLDTTLIREQEKMIEHMARIVAEQAVKLRIMEIALQKKR